MIKKISPKSVNLPVRNYVGATVVEPGSRMIFVSGSVGIDVSGTMASGIGEQTRVALTNVLLTLDDQGLGVNDIVKLNFFVKSGQNVEELRSARDKVMNLVPVASTVIFISDFVIAGLLVEIDCIAAK